MTDCILTRHSSREFKENSLTEAEISQLIAAFQAAPCGMNQTDVMQGIVIKDKKITNEIDSITSNSCYHAPVLFLINTKTTSEFGVRDASVAAEIIMIEANSLNIGSVYVLSAAQRINQSKQLREELKISKDFKCQVVVCLGYSAEDKEVPTKRNRYQVKVF